MAANMKIDPRLENYLSTLDRALAAIPTSDRADIVTELKSHVLSALEREPQPSLDSVLESLGEPETVANRYLLERGLKPAKPPISSAVKWIVIAFLGTLAIGVMGAVALIFHFSPKIRTGENGRARIEILDGWIDLDTEGDQIRIGGKAIQDMQSRRVSGQAEIPAGGGDRLTVQFSNGRLRFETTAGRQLTWECKGGAGKSEERAEIALKSEGVARTLDLAPLAFSNCRIGVPEKMDLTVRGANGKVEFERPRYSIDAEVANAKLDLEPDPARKYAYDLEVGNGKVPSVVSDPNPDHRVRMRAGNGKIDIDTR